MPLIVMPFIIVSLHAPGLMLSIWSPSFWSEQTMYSVALGNPPPGGKIGLTAITSLRVTLAAQSVPPALTAPSQIAMFPKKKAVLLI
jgi:hypothetical protein